MLIETGKRLLLVAFCLFPNLGYAESFKFESVGSINEMHGFLRQYTPVGTSQSRLRTLFVEQGGAKLHPHPQRPNIEKYVYDINLCDLYVWRWYISANFNKSGMLTQVYLNGDSVHPLGDKPRDPAKLKIPGAKQQILKMQKPRPEASKGEKVIAYLLFDLDAVSLSVDEEFVIGAGPSNVNPANMGKLNMYKSVERWRSIFDEELAWSIVAYDGDCPE